MAAFNPNERTAPTIISGQRGPEQQNTVRVVPEVSDQILMYLPEATPLLTLTGKMREKRVVFNPTFQWLEKDQYPRMTTAATAQDDDDTTVDVAAGTGTRYAANYLIKNLTTGEVILITTVATDTLTITRGIGGNAAPITIGDKFLFIGTAYEDGADIGTLKSIQEFNLFNYTQIFRTPFGFTGRDLVVELFGGRDKTTETKAATIEHKKSIEYGMFFGRRNLSTGTHQRTMTGGLDYYIATNAWNVAGTPLNERTFNEFLEQGMKWGLGGNMSKGAGKKYLLASSRWLTEINDWAGKKLQYRVLDEQIGFSAVEYVSPHGSVMLLRAPLLDEYHPDRAYLVDLNHLRYASLRDRDTRLLQNRQGPGIDGESHEYLSDVGIQVEFEQSHGVLMGLSV